MQTEKAQQQVQGSKEAELPPGQQGLAKTKEGAPGWQLPSRLKLTVDVLQGVEDYLQVIEEVDLA